MENRRKKFEGGGASKQASPECSRKQSVHWTASRLRWPQCRWGGCESKESSTRWAATGRLQGKAPGSDLYLSQNHLGDTGEMEWEAGSAGKHSDPQEFGDKSTNKEKPVILNSEYQSRFCLPPWLKSTKFSSYSILAQMGWQLYSHNCLINISVFSSQSSF